MKRPRPAKNQKKWKAVKVSAKRTEKEEKKIREALGDLLQKAKERFKVLGEVQAAANKDGSVDGQLIIRNIGDENGERAHEIMLAIDEYKMLVPPSDSWVTIGVTLSKWSDPSFDEEINRLEESGFSEEEAEQHIRGRYARFKGLDFVASFPQRESSLVRNQLTARELLKWAIQSRGGFVKHLVYRLGWKLGGGRPEELRLALKKKREEE